MTERAYQSTLAEAAKECVTGAVSSPKKFDSDEDVTSPASIALTLEESNSSGGGELEYSPAIWKRIWIPPSEERDASVGEKG